MKINGWNEVNLGIFERMNEISQRDDETDRAVGLVALLNGMKEEDVYDLPLDKFSELMGTAGWMDTPPEITQPREDYKINGKDYKLTMNFRKLTTGQYLDFQSYTKTQDYTQMLSVFLIPKGHKYNDGYDIFEVQQDMKTLPVGEVLGMMGFFIILYRSWSQALLKYSSRILRKEAKKNPEIAQMREQMEKAADMFGFL